MKKKKCVSSIAPILYTHYSACQIKLKKKNAHNLLTPNTTTVYLSILLGLIVNRIP